MTTNSSEYMRAYMRKYRAAPKEKAFAEAKFLFTKGIDHPATWGRVAQFSKQLRVPVGLLANEPFTLQLWQLRWLRHALADGVREAGLSVARKNGKSALLGVVILYYLVVEAKKGWRGVVASLNEKLSNELKEQIVAIAEASQLSEMLTIRQRPNRITCGGAYVDFLAANKATGHGIGADMAVFDELGLTTERERSLVNALRSAGGARTGSRFVAISVQGTSPMFDELRQRAEASKATYFRRYAADPACALDDDAQWRKANPGLGVIRSKEELADFANAAKLSPADETSFRQLYLNQAVDVAENPLVDLKDWIDCEVKELPAREGVAYLGIDLGGSLSMSAAVAYWPKTGRLEGWAAVCGEPDLMTRGERDRVGDMYVRMHARKELMIFGDRTVDVEAFLHHVLNVELDGVPIEAYGADRFRGAELKQVAEAVGLNVKRFHARGTGKGAKADGSADVRNFQRAVLAKQIKHKRSALETKAMAESTCIYDERGNPALNRRHSSARNDYVQAAVIAVSLASIAPPVERSIGFIQMPTIRVL